MSQSAKTTSASVLMVLGVLLLAVSAQPGSQIWQAFIGAFCVGVAMSMVVSAARCGR